MSGISLYQNLGKETLYREYKEAVLSIPGATVSPEDCLDISNGILSDEYVEKIHQQVMHDMYRYIPRYVACFLNSYRKRHYSWYYGVNDDGDVLGFPIHHASIDYWRNEIQQMFRYLLFNHVNIVIDSHHLDVHLNVDRCRETHTVINYLENNKWQVGYTCISIKKKIIESVRFQMVPLSIINNTPPVWLQQVPNRLAENETKLRVYHEQKRIYDEEYMKWTQYMNYYSAGIDLLLTDENIIKSFYEYTKTYPYKAEDYCTTPKFGDCFKVGNRLIKNPPFLDLFRDYRDAQRAEIRKHRPIEPKHVKSIKEIVLNRLGVSNYLFLNQTKSPPVAVLPVALRLSCRAISYPQRLTYKAIFYDGKYWQTQRRRMRHGSPECVNL